MKSELCKRPEVFMIKNIPKIEFIAYILEDFENASPYFCTFLANRKHAIEKLLAGFNVQPRIGMDQSLIRLHYHATLLMSHGYIQHLSAQLNEAFGLFLCLNCGVYDTTSPKDFIDFF